MLKRGGLLTRPRLRKGSGYSDEEVEAYCRTLEELAQVVRDPPPLTGVVVRDPNDDVIVACALKARADRIVTREGPALARRLPGNPDGHAGGLQGDAAGEVNVTEPLSG